MYTKYHDIVRCFHHLFFPFCHFITKTNGLLSVLSIATLLMFLLSVVCTCIEKENDNYLDEEVDQFVVVVVKVVDTD